MLQKITPDGSLSLDRLRSVAPRFAKAVQEGIEWEVPPWQVEDKFGDVMELFQESGSNKNMLAQGESRLEVLAGALIR